MIKFNLPFDKKDILLSFLIFLLAFSLRILYLKEYKNTSIYPVMSYSDSYYYYNWARDIVSNDVQATKAFMKWPLYAYVLGALLKLTQNNLSMIHLLQFLLGALNCVLIYFIAVKMFNRIVAFISAVLSAFYGMFIFYDGLLMYTSLSLFLNLLLFLLVLHIHDRPDNKNMFLLGLVLGICTITQANILFFGLLTAIIILARDKLKKKVILKSLFFLLGLIIIIGGVTLKNYLAEKDLVLIAGNLGFNFYSGNNPQATGIFYCPNEIVSNQEDMFRDAKIVAQMKAGRNLKTSEVSAFWSKKAFAFIRYEPVRYLKLLCAKFIFVFSQKEFVHDIEFNLVKNKIGIFKVLFMDLTYILPLALLGIVLSLSKLKETVFLYLITAVFTVSIAMFFVTTRYRIAMAPFLMIFAAYALFVICLDFSKRKYLKAGLMALGIIVLTVALNYSTAFAKRMVVNDEENNSLFNSYMLSAVFYERTADYKSAVRELNRAIELYPNNPRPQLRLGIIYMLTGDNNLALKKLKEMSRAYPYSLEAWYDLGFIYNRKKLFKQALIMLKRANFLDPDDLQVHFQIGIAYKGMGNKLEADKEFGFCLKNMSSWRKEARLVVKKEMLLTGK